MLFNTGHANTNQPLWQRVTMRLVADESAFGTLSEVERDALWQQAVSIMKPDAQELQILETDEQARDAYMLRFIHAYRAGLPPLSTLTERPTFPPPDKT